MTEDFRQEKTSDDNYLDAFFADRNEPIETPTSFELDYKFDVVVPEDEQKVLRDKIIDRIQQGQPLHVFSNRANGDSMLIYAATHHVLSKVCEQQGIDPEEIDLRMCDSNKDYSKQSDFFNLTAEVNTRIFQQIGYDLNNPIYPKWFYARHAQTIAKAIGVDLIEEDFQHVPQLHRIETGPMSTFRGQAELKKDGRELRGRLLAETGGKGEIVVILQSGSFSEKRYSDEDVSQISQAIKAKHPRSHVIVVSDKKFLSEEVGRGQEASYTDFPIVDRFPVETAGFKEELSTDLSVESVDSVIYPKDMHELASYCYAADSIEATDSFWAHAGAGAISLRHGGVLPENCMRVLYTMADPHAWAIPGALSIQAEASYRLFKSETERVTVMSREQYHRSSRNSESQFGIEKADVQRVIKSI